MYDQQVEQYHWAIKQMHHAEHFQVRSRKPIKKPVSTAVFSLVRLRKIRAAEVIISLYWPQENFYKKLVAGLIFAG